MATALRKTGISVVGDVPWGTHFCHFYETEDDLLDTLSSYFKTGLENNEFCIWVVFDPLTEEDAKNALMRAIAGADRHLKAGDIEILSPAQMYLENGVLDWRQMIKGWSKKLDQALERGYDGMRMNGNEAWLKKGWPDFCQYEKELNESVINQQMIVLCAHPVANSSGIEILDVMRNHQFAIARREGNWEIVAPAEFRQAKAIIERLNEELEQKVIERTQELADANAELRREIAERQQIEEVIRENESFLRQIAELTPVVLDIFDLYTEQPAYFSKDVKDIYGYTPDEIAQMKDPVSRMVHPEDQPLIRENMERLKQAAGGEIYEIEYRLRRRDGQWRWMTSRTLPFARNEQGEVRQIISATFDITERKQSEEILHRVQEELEQRIIERTTQLTTVNEELRKEIVERERATEALRREKERTEHIISAAPTLVVGIAPDGATTFINQAITHVTGYKPEEIVGQNWWHINYPGAEYKQVDRLFEEFEQGRGVVNYEMTLTTKSGSKRTISWNSVNRLNEQEEIIEVIGIGADVTERRELEEQLRQSQKLEAIGQLAGGVAHDFNNLLTVITGYSELILTQLIEGDPLRDLIGEIQSAGERATSLTRQLLAFSRKQIVQPKVLDLNIIVSEMEKMLQRLIGEDIELQTLLDPKLGSVKADPGQIEQVIMNFAVNARDAMPHGGRLIIETANVYLDEEYAAHHIEVKSGPYTMLAVSDTGIGMNEETQRHIFEPFFTTKEVGKGTGLGLSTVYGIVKQSGGNIWVYSEIGQGTTFKIHLPRVNEDGQD